MKKLTFVIPIMILVAFIAMWMLKKDYSEIDLATRMIIAAGASILSGVISFFLIGADKGRN
ncbi:histidine kinase [Bacillus sp. FJAT-29790]|uniref:histidine kinase n=1 Tax=Bacillus sp. FJAT-29790 TaxID=1895002 RepID=UPI001C233715|nr:histidine kinase [Bacillus sp. FJAT-29790]MBU8880401.1 histidine kinase [Bacillus sp. FJAT-29790]